MREDDKRFRLAERVAEGRAPSPVDHVRGDHGKVQSRVGISKNTSNLIDLRTVLGCRDVEFDQALHGLLTSTLADAQVGRLATGRTDAAGLEAKFVEPAVFRARLAEPIGG